MNKINIAAIVLISLISCSKADQANPVADRKNPTINIYYPCSNEVYQPGQQLCFKALLEDNTSLYNVAASISDKTNKTIKKFEYFPGSKIFVLDQKYSIPENITDSFTLVFEATDNQGNSVKSSLTLSVKY